MENVVVLLLPYSTSRSWLLGILTLWEHLNSHHIYVRLRLHNSQQHHEEIGLDLYQPGMKWDWPHIDAVSWTDVSGFYSHSYHFPLNTNSLTAGYIACVAVPWCFFWEGNQRFIVFSSSNKDNSKSILTFIQFWLIGTGHQIQFQLPYGLYVHSNYTHF